MNPSLKGHWYWDQEGPDIKLICMYSIFLYDFLYHSLKIQCNKTKYFRLCMVLYWQPASLIIWLWNFGILDTDLSDYTASEPLFWILSFYVILLFSVFAFFNDLNKEFRDWEFKTIFWISVWSLLTILVVPVSAPHQREAPCVCTPLLWSSWMTWWCRSSPPPCQWAACPWPAPRGCPPQSRSCPRSYPSLYSPSSEPHLPLKRKLYKW